MNFLHSTSQKFTEIPRFYIFWNDIIYLDLLRNLLCLRHKVQRVPQCMSPRRNWVLPPPPLPQASVPLTPEAKGGGHTCLPVRGWGSPNSDDWRKSLALCLLCGLRNLLYTSEFCTGTVYLSRCSLLCTMCTGEGHELVLVHADQRLREQDLISFHHSEGNPAGDQLVRYLLYFFAAVLWIRIQIGSGFMGSIRIRIQEGKNGPEK